MGRRTFGEFGFALTFWFLFWGTVMLTFSFLCRFEAYDEPWKESFDTATQKWESKWGLMDENRQVKNGLVIPDCGGMTVDKAF